MPIQVACSRGCGTTIEVSDEQIQEFIDLKRPIIVSHDSCPQEQEQKQKELRQFHISIHLTEIRGDPESGDYESEELASLGGDARATSFTEALPELVKVLNKQWDQIAAMSQVIDGA